MGSERAWLERRLEKALEAEQAACDRAQSLERQCATLDEEVNTPVLDAFWVALILPFGFARQAHFLVPRTVITKSAVLSSN